MKINKKKTQIAICIALALGIVANIFTYTTFFPLFRGAGMNFLSIEKVLAYYYLQDNKEKKAAALFLLQNITNHNYYQSEAISNFTSQICQADTIIKEQQMNKLWNLYKIYNHVQRQFDIKSLSGSMLIDNINFSYKVWKTSKWKNEIDFHIFCNYILPYRVMGEKPEKGWKEYLFSTYSPLIHNVSDLKRAFFLVHDSIEKQLKHAAYDYPYQLNPYEMQNIMKGDCMQRCIYEVAVMRSLGIPAVIDGIDCWANYSKNGHSWVALVTKNGTYTVSKNDSCARMNNTIDASIFELKKSVPSDFPYDTTFKKRCAKVIRYHYATQSNNYNDYNAPENIYQHFSDTHTEDVSAAYGFIGELSFPAKKEKYCYLCTYRTGRGWLPIAFTKAQKGYYKFKNLGDSIVYLPIVYTNKTTRVLSNPILATNISSQTLQPNLAIKQSVTLDRKYPLVNTFFNEWNYLFDGQLDASQTTNFQRTNWTYQIKKTPTYKNDIDFPSTFQCRSIRFSAPKGCKAPVAEFTFWCNNKKIICFSSSKDAEDLAKLTDGDPFSMPNIKYRGYQIYFDFGKNTKLDKLTFVPKNDGNFVVPGFTYQLYYYDKQWKSLGMKTATKGSITFDNIPTNALLLLKDISKGEECRPFTFVNGKQTWW